MTDAVRELESDPCVCGHIYGDHSANAPHRCLHGTPSMRSIHDPVACDKGCQTFRPVEVRTPKRGGG